MKNMIRKLEGKQSSDNKNEIEDEMNEMDFLQLVLHEMNNKTFHLVGAFDEEQLRKFKDFSSNLYFYEDDPNPIIQIRISSCGGQVNVLLGMLSVIEDLKRLWDCKVHCHIDGYAFSCGALLFLIASDIRTMNEYSQLMIHEMSYGINDSLNGHRAELLYTEKLQKRIDKMIENNTGLSLKVLNKWYKQGDVYLFKEDMEKLGILTEEMKNEDRGNGEQ